MSRDSAPAPPPQPRALFIEDRDDDVVLELAALRGGGIVPVSTVVDDPQGLRDALARERFDVVIADYHLPEFSGLDALQIVRQFDRDVPFILVSGTVGEQVAVDAMRAGVNDYVLKHNLVRLPAAVARELRDAAMRREKRRIEAEQRFFADAQRLLAEVGRVVSTSLDAETTVRESARVAVPMLGDGALGFLLEGGARLRLVERAAADPAAHPWLASDAPAAPDAGAPADAEHGGGAHASAHSPRPVRLGDAELTEMVLRDGHVRALQAGAPCSIAVVPVRGRNSVLGAFVFARVGASRAHDEREAALARDFADRVGLAVENAQLFAAAQEGLRVRDEFLAMLGHELRNPLAPIVTALELLKVREPPGAEPRRELVVIDRQTRYLIRLVDDLLDIARVTRGKVSLDRRPIELAVAAAKAVEAAGPLIEQRKHRLECDVPARGLLVDADEIRLTQVLTNLLTNAARYTPEGGHIRVRAAREGGEVVVAVTDNGTGIAPELFPRLFDSFVQGHRSIDRSEGGLGLGLALVRNLVELHGGAVSVYSEGPGRGSEFTVRLPALDADAAAAAAANDAARGGASTSSRPAAAPRRAPGRRVLLVDDNVDATEMLATLLADHGFEVRAVHSSREALELAPGFAPDVAVLDIGLPEMDGYELAARLREHFGRTLRLLAVTGYGQARDQARSRAAGFDAHLVKPVDVDALVAALAPSAAR